MSIEEIRKKIKTLLETRHSTERLVFSGILIISVVLSYHIGSASSYPPEASTEALRASSLVSVPDSSAQNAAATPLIPVVSEVESSQDILSKNEAPVAAESVVASKNGTKFYLPSCSGVARINEENKIVFTSREAAVAAGYTPAATCPGL